MIIGAKRSFSPLKSQDQDSDNDNNDNDNNNNNNDKLKSEIFTKKFKKDNNLSSIEFEIAQSSNLIIKKNFINITTFSGNRKTRSINLDNSNNTTTPSYQESINKSSSVNLLSKSIPDLLKEIEDKEHNDLLESLKENNKNELVQRNGNEGQSKVDNRLWVDKYSPISYHDLISDDKMNRDIYNWLKLWDHVVFDKPLPKTATKLPQQQDTRAITSKYNNSNIMNNNHYQYTNLLTALQDDGTPQIKVLLLTGGPGLGKTTLAHILAKQAGYLPVEINASEKRSGESFERMFLDAIEMKSMFLDRKPNCLIIDEIDGISGRDNGPVELILKLIENSVKHGQLKKNDDGSHNDQDDANYEEYENQQNKSDGGMEKKKKNEKKKAPVTRLLRPIICICNDQYAPSLRKLRQKAFVFNFSPPKKTRLLGRLKEICVNESLASSDTALTSLIDMTGSDIRSCINSLQFIKSKHGSFESSTLKANKASFVVGLKDMERGLFDLWKDLFKQSTSTTSASSQARSMITPKSKSIMMPAYEKSPQYDQLKQQVNACSQKEKLIEGLFENYLSNMTNDFSFEKTIDCLDWMIFSDTLGPELQESFHSIVPLAIHTRCTTYAPKVIYPHADYDNFVKKKNIQSIKDSFYQDLDPSILCFLSKNNFAIDFVYPFMDILSPALRAVSPQLYSQREKLNLNHLLEIMKSFKLVYQVDYTKEFNNYRDNSDKDKDKDKDNNDKEKKYNNSNNNNNNTPHFKLEPPIDVFLYYQHLTSDQYVKRYRLSNNQKQIVSSALVTYKPLHVQKAEEEAKRLAKEKEKEKFKTPVKPISKIAAEKQPLPVLKDFFGRIIPISPESNDKSNSSGSGNPQHPIKYRYQEGFTNAIKKTVYVKDFL
ncbi:hypothetical protein CYY_000175 [Polysphondylium violaceum]|uniref:AAA+ ATPase domain-containing protein n=1 Tax=Polysphondylium violaceum TaxID=133409 RepID=A0A8J4QBJ2_9MYCE|nr:hypothetical protein CYY_000175 [Polysphondylium violaceum]